DPVVGQFEADAKSGRPGARGSPAFRSLPSPKRVEGGVAARCANGRSHPATTGQSWQDRTRPKPKREGSGGPCLELPRFLRCCSATRPLECPDWLSSPKS